MRSTPRSMIAIAALLLASAGMAEARQHRFVGIHPIKDRPKGGMCYIEVPHVHAYAPARPQVLYRLHDGDHHFVGDPVVHGYDGPKHGYYGHHPVHVHAVIGAPVEHVEYCYIDGPHYHHFAPPPGVKFKLQGDVHFYAGDYPDEYRTGRDGYVKINAYYRPIVWERPVVTVVPVEYHGPRLAVHVVAPHAHVHAPALRAGLEVHVPVPTVELHVPSVHIGASAGVVVGGHGHVHRGHVVKHKHKHKQFKRFDH